MGKYGLDNMEYDEWLAKGKKERMLRERHNARRTANKGIKGWHFGIGDRPVYTRDKEDFKRELDKRGLMMRDDVQRNLR